MSPMFCRSTDGLMVRYDDRSQYRRSGYVITTCIATTPGMRVMGIAFALRIQASSKDNAGQSGIKIVS